ncbi:MAG: hypothetical protein U5K76_15895 [Woeseiaceae bacterium]|nr:hypothetical protein [Woeseiaceae bacterium]
MNIPYLNDIEQIFQPGRTYHCQRRAIVGVPIVLPIMDVPIVACPIMGVLVDSIACAMVSKVAAIACDALGVHQLDWIACAMVSAGAGPLFQPWSSARSGPAPMHVAIA